MKSIALDASNGKRLLRIAQILKTLAHPTRLNIIKLSNNNKIIATDIHKKLDYNCEQSMLSHHLTKIKDRGILKSSKEKKFIYYSLTDNKILSLFDCMEKYTFLYV